MRSPASIRVGLSLMPHEPTLELLAPLIEEEAELYEVTPETLWFLERDQTMSPNGFHRHFEALRERTGRPFVAHGVGWSSGSADSEAQAARDESWLQAIRETHAAFSFEWYTDHLGVTVLAGEELTLPLALPMTEAMAHHVGSRLSRLQAVVPDVGLENTCAYYLHGSPAEEPGFLSRILSAPRQHLLLDLHNVYTMSLNFGFDAAALAKRMPLERVIEIHVSGGSQSDAGWLQSGETLRLDSHDAAVPEAVWRLAEELVPLCPNLRAVVLERMEGTASESDVPILREELQRIRRLRERSCS